MSEPRYEFRIFADDLSGPIARLQRLLGDPGAFDAECSEERYFLSEDLSGHIIKLRGGMLDIKERLEDDGLLQRWRLIAKDPFPVEAARLEELFFGPLHLTPPQPLLPLYDLESFSAMAASHPGIQTFTVTKKRRRSRVDGILCEIDSVAVGTKTLKSLCCESADPDTLQGFIKLLGIGHQKNQSYLHLLRTLATKK